MNARRGRFITFEGIDGAGKSTQLAHLIDHLRAHGIEPLHTREPGGTPVGEALRTMILQQAMTPRAETLVMFAARVEHVARLIRPALDAGTWVVCDRFTDATYAYQCSGRGLAESDVATLEHWVHPDLQPDLTFLVDVDPSVAAARLAGNRAADRFESEPVEFFARVRAGYLDRARRHAHRFCVLDGAASASEVRSKIAERIAGWLRS
jgi:dTMP kinase